MVALLQNPVAVLASEGAPLSEMLAMLEAQPHAPQAVLLGGRALGDAGAAAALSELYASAVTAGVTQLDVSGNQLSAVPAGLGQLRSLRTLELSRNDIEELPLHLTELEGLTRLDLHGNRGWRRWLRSARQRACRASSTT